MIACWLGPNDIDFASLPLAGVASVPPEPARRALRLV
jgi:hypothetical protein